MNDIKIYTLQPSIEHLQSNRFDSVIVRAVNRNLNFRGYSSSIEVITGAGEDRSFVFHGETFVGLVHDAMILEDEETGKFWVIDYQDCDTGPAFMLSNSEDFAGAWLSMFNRKEIRQVFDSAGSKYELIAPGWFTNIDSKVVRNARIEVEAIRNQQSLDTRLLFAGTIDGLTPDVRYRTEKGGVRDVALVLRDKYPDEVRIVGDKFMRDEWLLEAAKHQIVLTLPGHPWCYREFEMFSLEIPVLTYRWVSELQHRWVPNFHYTAVEGIGERHYMGWPLDTELGADRIIKRYREVINNPALLATRARQAKAHYFKYFTSEMIATEIADFVLSAR